MKTINPIALWQEQAARWRAQRNLRQQQCPHCLHSSTQNVREVAVQSGGSKVTRRVSCKNCLAVWDEIYFLSDVEVVHPPDLFRL